MIQYYVRVRTKDQLETAIRWGRADVILPDGELSADIAEVCSVVSKKRNSPQIVLCLPDVLRQSRASMTRELIESMSSMLPGPAGLLIRNLDELGMVLNMGFQGRLIADSFLYAYNSEAFRFYRELFPDMQFIASDELTDREQEQSGKDILKEQMIVKVYGHQPLMISNQCLNRNYADCRKHLTSFTDNRKERFFVMSSCRHCYSTVYNGKCTWLLDKVTGTGYNGYDNLLFDFTVETPEEMREVLSSGILSGSQPGTQTVRPVSSGGITRGHHYKGVE